ncbi:MULTISPECIES: signal peptidase I [unclassified Candidatus Frackibacter]|uniref:signal peptidase I n=1 Tax=unclassified Candidatus Frackibacter TaxID=2648818 RepID=UPI000792FBC8|nr:MULTISPECIES: signal peptidase I [unclassified Candidatus Frackibacter]KXS44179.1 MAG: signal peptidase I [Candidatus Frackibacter sp. T328-2]SDC64127.1 signal peptidase I [Candidatus Frackibacter sp. WG11]SEM77739.1 signal peptidase I [Candidatus Frackibacter sp. WG12]SFL88361.1 signal peptidase I [Candidatus Frackibacter sp. WG13]
MQVTRKEVKELVESVVIAGILAFFIITFIAQSFVVQGQSMEPTLHNGERLFVDKLSYRFSEPARGDIIVFTPKGAPGRKYIKRVIGLPGDRVKIRNKKVYINGKQIKENYILEATLGNFGPYKVPKNHLFVLGDNRNNSADSRYSSLVGFVSYDSISGKAFWVYWPLTNMRVIDHQSYEHLN